MRAVVAISALSIAACWSLQLEAESGSPGNSILIRSKTYNVTESNASLPPPLRRTVVVQEQDSEENYTEPKLPQYAIDCGADKACLEAHGMDPPGGTFKPYTQEELEKLLAQYAASQATPGPDSPASKLANLYMDDEDAVINVLEAKDHDKSKSASWHLVQSQKHDHPYEDHKGWVTLEPVPWAHSQIQKWEPNAKPQIPTWDQPAPPQPAPWASRPAPERPWGKPTYEYKPSRPQYSPWTRPESQTSHWSQDIITDNQPGYWPAQQQSQRPWPDQQPYGSNRPPQTYNERPESGYHGHPSTHPSEGEGQWVLLSSTKGYSVPHRHRGAFQRALSFDTKASSSSSTPTVSASVSSRRTVRLTVLPADNSTNTTLSHGGLLEVEHTLQTVEEAQREHAAKMLRLRDEGSAPPAETAAPAASRRSGDAVRVFAATPPAAQSKTAVLAAIGAGMIPATVAMLLPMVLGRRRRDVDERPLNRSLDTVLRLPRAERSKAASY